MLAIVPPAPGGDALVPVTRDHKEKLIQHHEFTWNQVSTYQAEGVDRVYEAMGLISAT
jgi:hypothetical protein